MMRREMIIVEPYRRRRFNSHRRRVASASPTVDAGPPCRPRHVVEPDRRRAERRQRQWRQLEVDLRLMRALADIMNSKRMDDRNPDFDKYRQLLRRSRARSVDRSPPLPPPPDLDPTHDQRGHPVQRPGAAGGASAH
ncbi:uncharacterized protein LOC119109985 [Pollicipes pollicipes]|uniref:uncharacterized protein LOC119109985 n=1 Tax=Pollicipes pollicipes TaxID=41117 RepID=UPI0018852F19|nr:uncharacterized protein LOC119109985 [Pollicipes pollicipes]